MLPRRETRFILLGFDQQENNYSAFAAWHSSELIFKKKEGNKRVNNRERTVPNDDDVAESRVACS